MWPFAPKATRTLTRTPQATLFLPPCSPSRQPAEGSSHRRAELGSLVSGWKPGPLLRTGHHPVRRGDQRLLRARDILSLGHRCVWKSIAHVGCTVFWMSCCSECAWGAGRAGRGPALGAKRRGTRMEHSKSITWQSGVIGPQHLQGHLFPGDASPAASWWGQQTPAHLRRPG